MSSGPPMRRAKSRASVLLGDAHAEDPRACIKDDMFNGWVQKKSPAGFKGFRRWQDRYLRFMSSKRDPKGPAQFLAYFKSEAEIEPIDKVPLEQIISVDYLPDKRQGCRFNVVITNNRAYEFDCLDVEDAIQWVRAIKRACYVKKEFDAMPTEAKKIEKKKVGKTATWTRLQEMFFLLVFGADALDTPDGTPEEAAPVEDARAKKLREILRGAKKVMVGLSSIDLAQVKQNVAKAKDPSLKASDIDIMMRDFPTDLHVIRYILRNVLKPVVAADEDEPSSDEEEEETKQGEVSRKTSGAIGEASVLDSEMDEKHVAANETSTAGEISVISSLPPLPNSASLPPLPSNTSDVPPLNTNDAPSTISGLASLPSIPASTSSEAIYEPQSTSGRPMLAHSQSVPVAPTIVKMPAAEQRSPREERKAGEPDWIPVPPPQEGEGEADWTPQPPPDSSDEDDSDIESKHMIGEDGTNIPPMPSEMPPMPTMAPPRPPAAKAQKTLPVFKKAGLSFDPLHGHIKAPKGGDGNAVKASQEARKAHLAEIAAAKQKGGMSVLARVKLLTQSQLGMQKMEKLNRQGFGSLRKSVKPVEGEAPRQASKGRDIDLRILRNLRKKEFIRNVLSVFSGKDDIAKRLAIILLWYIAPEEFASYLRLYCSGTNFTEQKYKALKAILLLKGSKLIDKMEDTLQVSFSSHVSNADTWQGLFYCLTRSPFQLRSQALDDINSMLINNPHNCSSIEFGEAWQVWIFPLLTDIRNDQRQSDEMLRSLVAKAVNVVVLVIYEVFFARDYACDTLYETLDRLRQFAGHTDGSQRIARGMLTAFVSKLRVDKARFGTDYEDEHIWRNFKPLMRVFRRFVLQTSYWATPTEHRKKFKSGNDLNTPKSKRSSGADKHKFTSLEAKIARIEEEGAKYVLYQARREVDASGFVSLTSNVKFTDHGLHFEWETGLAADEALTQRVIALLQALGFNSVDSIDLHQSPGEMAFFEWAQEEYNFWNDTLALLRLVKRDDIEVGRLITYRQLAFFTQNFLKAKNSQERSRVLKEVQQAVKAPLVKFARDISVGSVGKKVPTHKDPWAPKEVTVAAKALQEYHYRKLSD